MTDNSNVYSTRSNIIHSLKVSSFFLRSARKKWISPGFLKKKLPFLSGIVLGNTIDERVALRSRRRTNNNNNNNESNQREQRKRRLASHLITSDKLKGRGTSRVVFRDPGSHLTTIYQHRQLFVNNTLYKYNCNRYSNLAVKQSVINKRD